MELFRIVAAGSSRWWRRLVARSRALVVRRGGGRSTFEIVFRRPSSAEKDAPVEPGQGEPCDQDLPAGGRARTILATGLDTVRRLKKEDAMVIVTACRDFALGLARGLSFFLTERHDGEPSYTVPEVALARCFAPKRQRRVSSAR